MAKPYPVRDSVQPLWRLGDELRADSGLGYTIDHTYRDSSDNEQNEFYTWLKVKNSGGMRPRTRRDGSLAYLGA